MRIVTTIRVIPICNLHNHPVFIKEDDVSKATFGIYCISKHFIINVKGACLLLFGKKSCDVKLAEQSGFV